MLEQRHVQNILNTFLFQTEFKWRHKSLIVVAQLIFFFSTLESFPKVDQAPDVIVEEIKPQSESLVIQPEVCFFAPPSALSLVMFCREGLLYSNQIKFLSLYASSLHLKSRKMQKTQKMQNHKKRPKTQRKRAALYCNDT